MGFSAPGFIGAIGSVKEYAWASRPAASSVAVGTRIRISDFRYQEFLSDGTYWRPANGRVLIDQHGGLRDSPIASLSGVTSGTFTIPGGNPVIPADMIAPLSRVVIEHKVRRFGSNASANSHSRLCLPGSTSIDATSVSQISLGNNDGWFGVHDAYASFNDDTGKYFVTQNQPAQSYGYYYSNDVNADVDTTQDMEVMFSISAANAADSFSLLCFTVWLEG